LPLPYHHATEYAFGIASTVTFMKSGVSPFSTPPSRVIGSSQRIFLVRRRVDVVTRYIGFLDLNAI